MDIVLFGRQGSGKGTLGVALCERYSLVPFVTGDELRKLAKDPSPLGEKVKNIIEAGHLVPNDVVMEIIEHFMKNLAGEKSILFDGIPRKDEQAETFNALMQRLNRPFKGVLLSISEATAWQRLATRRICEKCKAVYPAAYEPRRVSDGYHPTDKPACEVCGGALITRNDDTNEEAIRNRLEAYEKETVPVIEQYKKEGNMLRIEGEGSIEEVKQRTFSELDPLLLKE